MTDTYWKDLWMHRELVYMFSWRDIKIRYKQTVIGASWSIIRPLVTILIFNIVFNRIAHIDNPSAAPYALMVAAGMLPWQFFSTAVADGSNSVINNAGLISKIYFPRLVIPASTLFTSLIDFLISVVIIVGFMVWYQHLPGWEVVLFPVAVLFMLIATMGVSVYLTALNVKYRDFRHLIPFVLQIGIYITPIAFSSKNIGEKWRLLYYLNPMVGVIDGFRWTLLGDSVYLPGAVVSLLVSLILLWSGVKFFKKMEKTFVDEI